MRRLCDRVLDWGETLVYRGVPDESLPPEVLRELDAYLEESQSKYLVVRPLRELPPVRPGPRPPLRPAGAGAVTGMLHRERAARAAARAAGGHRPARHQCPGQRRALPGRTAPLPVAAGRLGPGRFGWQDQGHPGRRRVRPAHADPVFGLYPLSAQDGRQGTAVARAAPLDLYAGGRPGRALRGGGRAGQPRGRGPIAGLDVRRATGNQARPTAARSRRRPAGHRSPKQAAQRGDHRARSAAAQRRQEAKRSPPRSKVLGAADASQPDQRGRSPAGPLLAQVADDRYGAELGLPRDLDQPAGQALRAALADRRQGTAPGKWS